MRVRARCRLIPLILLTWRFCARTTLRLLIPRTKHIESRIFDLPDPFSPVIELKLSSLFCVSGGGLAEGQVNKPAGYDCTDGI